LYANITQNQQERLTLYSKTTDINLILRRVHLLNPLAPYLLLKIANFGKKKFEVSGAARVGLQVLTKKRNYM
jgi:hypothetical protein